MQFVPMASFLGAIISSEDNAQFVQYALQLVELLVVKLPEVYRVSFIREGVGMSIEALAAKETKASLEPKKAIDEPGSSTSAIAKPNSADDPESEYSHARDLQRLTERYSAAGGGSREFRMSEAMRHLMEADDLIDARMSSFRSKQASALQPPYLHDANIWRAKVLCEKRLFDMDGDDSNEAKIVLDKLSALVATLSKQAASEGDLYDALRDMAGHFSSTGESLSSFELLRGGVIDGLLEFVDIDGTVPSAQRRSMLYEIFAETAPASSASPMTVLVKRLHESLGRLESFDVESAFNGMIDPTRPGGSALMRTLRIKLTAEPNQDLPKHVNNLVVSIQAIAPLGALADYLRTRVLDAASLSGLGRDRLLGSAGSSSSARAILEALEGGRQARLTQPSATAATGSGSSLTPAPAPAPPSAPGSGSAPIPPWNPRTPARAGGPKSTRRRSARLSAQITGTEETGTASEATPIPGATLAPPAAGADAAAPLSSSAPNASGSGIPTLPMDLDFDEDYSDVDDEYPEEVFEEDMEDELARPQEKVVNMNVAPGTSFSACNISWLTSRWLSGRGQDSRRYSSSDAHARFGPTGSYSRRRRTIRYTCTSYWRSIVCWGRQDCTYRLAPSVLHWRQGCSIE
jgi:E3 ubiquitin-protein ligase TRIP12